MMFITCILDSNDSNATILSDDQDHTVGSGAILRGLTDFVVKIDIYVPVIKWTFRYQNTVSIPIVKHARV